MLNNRSDISHILVSTSTLNCLKSFASTNEARWKEEEEKHAKSDK